MSTENKNRDVHSDQEYLAQVFSFTKVLWNKLSRVEGDYEHIQIGSNDADEIFKYMVSLSGFNGLPSVVSDKKFNTIKSPVIYRGVDKMAYAQNLLTENNYHHGKGYANGIFTTNKKNIALSYTRDINWIEIYLNKLNQTKPVNPDNIISLKVEKASKIPYQLLEIFAKEIMHGDFNNIENETKIKLLNFVNFVYSIENNEECLRFLNIFLQDLSKLAIYLGYDCISEPNGVIILNRGKIAVSQSEFDRIKEVSEKEAETSKQK